MLSFDIAVPRNGHYHYGWSLSDNQGLPIDLTDKSLSLKVSAVAGQGDIIAQADFDVWAPLLGKFDVTISGDDFDEVDGETEIVRLAYDFKCTDNDSIALIHARGTVLLFPGVS